MDYSISQAPFIVRMEDVGLSLSGAAGTVEILRHIDLSVPAGETLSITGPSGSGKTSLLMLIAGLEVPSSGHVHACGEELTGMTEDALALWRARNIGIVFQSFHLIPTMTALENAAIPLEFTGHPSPRKTAAETLEALGLSARMHHYPVQLSGGEQQRVAIARAFVGRPKLLLADEPSGNLDHDTGRQVIDLLFQLSHDFGTTLLMVTHDQVLAGRCQRIIRLSDGAIA